MMWAGIGVILLYVFPFDVGSYLATKGPRRKTNTPRVYGGWGLTWSHGTRAPPGLERTRAIQKLL